MELLYDRCCGLDVHKKSVVACLLLTTPGHRPTKTIRTFGTMTRDLIALRAWLDAAQCTHVAMESTGVFWKPVYNLLEDQFTVLVVNPQQIKALAGHKTDVKDAEWIADLLAHGLLRGSFIPSRAQRELRDLTRARTSLVEDAVRWANRIQQVLEDANIKLSGVVTDLRGKSGRDMLDALVRDESVTPAAIADLARGQLRKKQDQLMAAAEGQFGPAHRVLVREYLGLLDEVEASIARLDAVIAARTDPPPSPARPTDESTPTETGDGDEQTPTAVPAPTNPTAAVAPSPPPAPTSIALLDSIPGISRRLAEVIIAEMGTDMTRFPTAKHLASWVGVCPGNNESAGKRFSGQIRHGNAALRHALVEAAHAAVRCTKRNTYFADQYRRIAGHRGKKRGVIAVAHSLAVTIYHVLRRREPYRDLGANYFDQRDRQAVERRLIKRLEKLGNQVTIQPLTPAA